VNATQSALVWNTEDWWTGATAAGRLDGTPDTSLPANGMVWQYSVVDFLSWINGITWPSEWHKFEVVDANGNPSPLPARPLSRLVT
jgi:hypothetical protein